MMKTSKLTRILVTALVVCMIASFMLPICALAATTDAVNNAKNGVLQVNLDYTDDNNSKTTIASGTGFLINDNTVITCQHVVGMTDAELSVFAELLGKTIAEMKSRLSVSVTVSRDIKIPATIITESFEMDFAVLRLSNSLQGKSALAIRPSAEVKQAETVYAIGYPNISTDLQSYNTYTSDDATITQGIVNKIGMGENISSGANTNYIQTSCNLDYGNSGGPMVDENGNVIGVSQGVVGDEITEYYNAIAIDQVTEVLDALGIVYTSASAPVPTEAPVVTQPPVETQAVPVVTNPPVTEAPTLPVITQPEPEPSNNMGMILIIAAVVVVVIIVVVVVVVAGGKKKQPAAPVPPVRPNTAPATTPGGFAPPPTYPVNDAGETTVLGGGAGETTVLTRASVNGGTLVRKRTGEVVSINTDQFVIGRERKGVNYCIADNSSISRNHVRLSVRNGATYLTDLGAANGTFVNGVKVMPRQEIALKNGDKITLADEDLEFKN